MSYQKGLEKGERKEKGERRRRGLTVDKDCTRGRIHFHYVVTLPDGKPLPLQLTVLLSTK
jgi:hypothetical protein